MSRGHVNKWERVGSAMMIIGGPSRGIRCLLGAALVEGGGPSNLIGSLEARGYLGELRVGDDVAAAAAINLELRRLTFVEREAPEVGCALLAPAT